MAKTVYIWIAPGALVILAALGLAKGYSFPRVVINSFNQFGFSGMFIGGFLGVFILVWNLVLAKHSMDSQKYENLTISAAVFGFVITAFFATAFIFEVVNAGDPGSFLEPFVFLITAIQFVVIVEWVIPLALRSRKILSSRKGHLGP